MSTVKYGQISLYHHFNRIIKGPGTSLQSLALLEMFVIENISISPNFILTVLRIKNK